MDDLLYTFTRGEAVRGNFNRFRIYESPAAANGRAFFLLLSLGTGRSGGSKGTSAEGFSRLGLGFDAGEELLNKSLANFKESNFTRGAVLLSARGGLFHNPSIPFRFIVLYAVVQDILFIDFCGIGRGSRKDSGSHSGEPPS